MESILSTISTASPRAIHIVHVATEAADYDRLNRSLPASNRLADSLAADKLANSVRKINDGLRTLLDVQLAVSHGSGDLALTLSAIRFVLGEHEAREVCRQIEADGSGSAFTVKPGDAHTVLRAGKPKVHRNKPDPARRAKPKAASQSTWTERYSRCRHCDGPHWN
eukprot:5577039-Pleurochrysis_carterae.AAC.1